MPPVLVPHQPRRPAEARQVDQPDRRTVLHPRRCTARTNNPAATRASMCTTTLHVVVIDAQARSPLASRPTARTCALGSTCTGTLRIGWR